MSSLTTEITQRAPTVDALLALLSELSGRPAEALRKELVEHLAARLAFLLLGDVLGAPNYGAIESRVAHRFGVDAPSVSSLAAELAQTAAWIEAADVARKLSLRDLPYPLRQRLFAQQRNRCGVCGWCFSDEPPAWRSPEECQATLDHRTPFRLGGEALDNLWILCALCNLLKESRAHVGEHGRVWINNHVYYDGPRPVAFWTLKRDSHCVLCGSGPQDVRLRVRRRNDAGVWVVDNCESICVEHADTRGAIDY